MSGVEIGIYGKLPAHGDFVSLHTNAELTAGLYDWCNDVIYASRTKMGEVPWLKAYLVSPAWRFCMLVPDQPAQATAGVMLPSVDAAGRYFPLFLLFQLDAERVPTAWLFKEAEPLLTALEQSGIEALQRQLDVKDLQLLIQQKTSSLALGDAMTLPNSTELVQRRLPLVLDLMVGDVGGSLWWSSMSLNSKDKPFCSFAELPQASEYEALITGNGF
ncbi:type VI secretion system-associated protein TagF [Marinobacterium stanieri]|uniref:Type VI secretion system protein ImpM n=1 Tax=Marinobacterium stanieri TaxID=49186 RepID=A0A1N6X104_9GAMM|nr:type VI secretion system-associated protein TagF [Marinobacterium stanieri]SIQ96029.1 type VI secretion system protein ImpM [Marinobacterium stanieri]